MLTRPTTHIPDASGVMPGTPYAALARPHRCAAGAAHPSQDMADASRQEGLSGKCPNAAGVTTVRRPPPEPIPRRRSPKIKRCVSSVPYLGIAGEAKPVPEKTSHSHLSRIMACHRLDCTRSLPYVAVPWPRTCTERRGRLRPRTGREAA